MTDSLPPQKYKSAQYLERQAERAFALQVSLMLTGIPVKGVGNPADVYPLSKAADDAHSWNLGWPKNRHGHSHDHRFHSSFAFVDRRWTGQDRVDGTPEISVGTVKPDDGWSKTINNDTSIPLPATVEKQVELQRSNVHKLTTGITTELSSETTASASADVPGVGSASVSETLKAVLGTSLGTEAETAENNTESDKVTEDFVAPPFARLLVTEKRRRKVTVTPWVASGVRDFGLNLRLYHWVNQQSRWLHEHDLDYVSVTEYVQYWRGGDTRGERLIGWYEATTDQVRAALDSIEDEDNRKLSLEGEEREVYEDNSELDAQELPLPGHEKQYWFAYLGDASRITPEDQVPPDILAEWQRESV